MIRFLVLIALCAGAIVAGVWLGRLERPAGTLPGSPESRPTGPAAPAGAIHGVVVDDLGLPIPGARVTLTSPGSDGQTVAAATTGIDGRFALPTDGPGARLALIHHPDFPPQLRVACDRGAELGRVVLDEAPGLLVRVLAAESSLPLPGARVSLRPTLEDLDLPGVVRRAWHQTAITDVAGSATFYGVPAGAYDLAVEAEGRAVQVVTHLQSATPAAAQRLELRVVASPGPEAAVRPGDPSARTVRGRIRSRATGEPVPGARVRAARPAGWPDGPTPQAVTDAEGNFRLPGVSAGIRHLAVTSPGHQRRQVPVPPSEEPLDVLLDPGQPLTGRILSPAGLPLQDAVIECHEAEAKEPATGRRTRSGGAGRFTFQALPAGRYRVLVHAQGLPALHTREFAMDSDDGTDLGALRLPPGRTVRGVARDASGAPRAGVLIHLVPTTEELAGATAWSRSDGTFSLGPVAPGPYRMFYDSPPGRSPRAAARCRKATLVEILVADEDLRQDLRPVHR